MVPTLLDAGLSPRRHATHRREPCHAAAAQSRLDHRRRHGAGTRLLRRRQRHHAEHGSARARRRSFHALLHARPGLRPEPLWADHRALSDQHRHAPYAFDAAQAAAAVHEHLRKAGYIICWPTKAGFGKTDFNFDVPKMRSTIEPDWTKETAEAAVLRLLQPHHDRTRARFAAPGRHVRKNTRPLASRASATIPRR